MSKSPQKSTSVFNKASIYCERLLWLHVNFPFKVMASFVIQDAHLWQHLV